MAVLILAVYIVLILIRPMDWWEPVLKWQLVTIGAVAVFIVGMPKVLGRIRFVWETLPQMKMAVWFLIGAVFSWVPQFWFGGMQNAFVDVGKVIFFFLLILTLVNTPKDQRILLWTILFCVMWLSIHAIRQYIYGYGFGNQAPLPRLRDTEIGPEAGYIFQSKAFGTFDDPNDLCTILVVAIPLFYIQLRAASNWVLKIISLGGVVMAAFAAWCTNSRGGVIAIFGMTATYVISRTTGYKRIITLAVAVTCITIVAPSRFGGGVTSKDRATLWGDGLAMFKDHPLFGVGYYNFQEYSSEGKVAHNTFIHTLAELGLFGYLPLFMMLYLTVLHLRRLINRRNLISRNDFVLAVGTYAALVGYLTGLYFVSRMYQHIFYIILGLSITTAYTISARYGLQEQVYGQSRKDLRRGLIWGLGSVVIMWVTVRLANMVG